MIPGVEFLRNNHRPLTCFNETIVFSCQLRLKRERSTLKEVPKEFAVILEINTSNPQGLSAITLCVPFKSSSREAQRISANT